MKKLILALALLVFAARPVAAQKTGLDRANSMVTDSSAVSVIVYNAANKTMLLYRWKGDKSPFVLPLINNCSMVVIASQPLRIDTFDPSNDTEEGRKACLKLLEVITKKLNEIPPATPNGKIGVSNFL